jgi:hypothetical protein
MFELEDNTQVTSHRAVKNISDIVIDFDTLSIKLGTILPIVAKVIPTPKISKF